MKNKATLSVVRFFTFFLLSSLVCLILSAFRFVFIQTRSLSHIPFLLSLSVFLPQCLLLFSSFVYLKTLFSSSDNIASNERTAVNSESKRMLMEEAVAQFKVLSRHLPRGSEENHDKPQ